jgi:hypothetical protein
VISSLSLVSLRSCGSNFVVDHSLLRLTTANVLVKQRQCSRQAGRNTTSNSHTPQATRRRVAEAYRHYQHEMTQRPRKTPVRITSRLGASDRKVAEVEQQGTKPHFWHSSSPCEGLWMRVDSDFLPLDYRTGPRAGLEPGLRHLRAMIELALIQAVRSSFQGIRAGVS